MHNLPKGLDALLIHPGGREQLYQELGRELAAVEPPIWCRMIAGYLRDRGWSVAIIDSEAMNWDEQEVAKQVAAASPRLVVMVVYGHQPSASTQMMVAAGQGCSALKLAAPHLPILITGGHVAALPERTIREEAVDFACVGEGPVTIHTLLERWQAGTAWQDCPGLVFLQDGQVVINPPPPLLTDLDQDLHGQVWELLPMERYRAHNWHCFDQVAERQPYASIYTTLGCPFQCAFCCIHAPFGGNRYRRRSPESVVAEIDLLHQRYGVRNLKIADEMFVLHEGHVMSICDLLIQRGYPLNIWAYARVDTVKPRFLAKLAQAGFRWLALGIESGSALIRDGSRKRLDQEGIRRIVRQIQEAGIAVIGNYIFGLPDDDLATMQETLDLALELNCEFANFYSAMAYPGSPLHQQAETAGWSLPRQWSGYSQHSFDCQPLPTARITAAQVLRFRDDAFHTYFAHPPYLDMIEARFGVATRQHVAAMASHRLRRQLLEGGKDG